MTSAFHTPHCCSSGFFVSAQVPLATQTITTSLVFMHCMNGFLSLEVCYSQQCSRSHALYAGFPILLYASPLWPLYQALAYKHCDACSWYHAHFTIHCSFAVCQAYSGRYLYTVMPVWWGWGWQIRRSPFDCALQDGFWPDLMNGKHDHTTAVCVSLRWSGGLRVVRLPAGSWHGLPRW